MESKGKELKGVKSDINTLTFNYLHEASKSYYRSELDKLKSDSVFTNLIQITDSEGNKTKCLSLNVECIDEVLYYLQVLREELVRDK